jgi:mono/diheme cytochrome c family protein
MLKPFLTVAVLVLCGFPAVSQEPQPPASTAPAPVPAPQVKVPSPNTNLVNPVHPTPESQARAKQIYGFDCAMCHGANGDGKGDVNQDGKMKLLDYHDPASLRGLSDGEIYTIIDSGKGDMPPENGRAKPEQIWNLVIYLRTFSKSPVAAAHP